MSNQLDYSLLKKVTALLTPVLITPLFPSLPLIVSEVRNMLCLYNTPVVHNSEIRFDFVTLSCFGYYHLKHITLHGPTPFMMAAVHGNCFR